MRSDKETVLDIYGQKATGEQFDRRQTEKELADVINNKNQQIAILHQVNSRLGYELSFLQRKLGIDSSSVLREMEKLGDMSVAVHTDLGQLEYLDHLLIAYDETILKQKKIIAMLYSQLQDGERKAQSIIREKDYLLEQNKNKCKKILEIYHRGYPEENLTTAYMKLVRQMQNEKSLLVREQSQHITDAYHHLESKSIEMETQLQQEKLNASKYYEAFKRQSEELKESLMSVDNLLKVKEFLEKTVNKLTEQNIALQSTKNDNEARLGKLESEIKSLRSQLFTQKKISRQDSQRSSIEGDTMKSELEHATKRQRQTFNKLMMVEKDLQTSKDNLRVLKREHQKVKSDFEQTLKMCETYQSRIASLTRREGTINEMVDQSKQKMSAVLLQRDKSILKVQQLEKVLENMSGRHRQELQKQRQNYEHMLTQIQQKMRAISEEKEDTQSLFMESQLSYKNQVQKLKRENSILHEQNIRFVENIRVNTGSEIINKLKQFESKNESLTKILNQKERSLKETEGKNEELRHEYDGELRNLNRLLDKERGLTSQYMKQITQERSRANILSNEKECIEGEHKRLKKTFDSRNSQMNDEREYRVVQLQNKLSEAIRKQKETRGKAIQMLEKYDAAEQKLKGEYEKRIIELQTQNEKVRKKLAKLKQ